MAPHPPSNPAAPKVPRISIPATQYRLLLRVAEAARQKRRTWQSVCECEAEFAADSQDISGYCTEHREADDAAQEALNDALDALGGG